MASELRTSLHPGSSAPGLPQYLGSLTRLALAAAWGQDLPVPLSTLLGASLPELRLLALDALWERLSAPSGLALPPDLGTTVLGLAVTEGHAGCLCKVRPEPWGRPGRDELHLPRSFQTEFSSFCALCQMLRILDHVDPAEWLPQVEACARLSPKAFLSWTLDLASRDRYGPCRALGPPARPLGPHLQ